MFLNMFTSFALFLPFLLIVFKEVLLTSRHRVTEMYLVCVKSRFYNHPNKGLVSISVDGRKKMLCQQFYLDEKML